MARNINKLGEAFGEFTKEIVEKVNKVNMARWTLEKAIRKNTGRTIVTQGTRTRGDGVLVREYENAMEDLKRYIENRDCSGQHNEHLERVVETGRSGKASLYNRHAIRALEVELVSPQVDEKGKVKPSESMDDPDNPKGKVPVPEWWIKAVRVRGLISIQPAEGNESPSYSSRSSSSSVAPAPVPS